MRLELLDLIRMNMGTDLEIAAGVMEGLKEEGCDVSWQGYISQHPQGNKLVCRQKGAGNTPYVVFVSMTNVWVCFDDGSTLARFDLNHPDSLRQIANFMKRNDTGVAQAHKRLPAELPTSCQIALSVKQSDYDDIVADWESRERNNEL